MTVQPCARVFFKDVRDFEGFVANLADGARWQFLKRGRTVSLAQRINLSHRRSTLFLPVH
jgi:hypothetical protein